MNEDRKEQRGDELKELKSEDANAVLTEESAPGAGRVPDRRPAIGGGSDGSDAALRSDTDRTESPAGLRNTGAAGDDLPQNEMPDSGSPVGAVSPGDEGVQGTIGSINDNAYGRVVGPDSPADERADLERQAENAQGDPLANRLGGGEGRGIGMAGAGAATGDMSASRAEAARGEPDEERAGATAGSGAGSPGGTGNSQGRTHASSRPPGGESPQGQSGRGD